MFYKSELLTKLEQVHHKYDIEQIDEAIEELERIVNNNYGMPSTFKNKATEKGKVKLKFLYAVREKREVFDKNQQVHKLRDEIESIYLEYMDEKTARGKVFNLWAKANNQRKGYDFIISELEKELEKMRDELRNQTEVEVV